MMIIVRTFSNGIKGNNEERVKAKGSLEERIAIALKRETVRAWTDISGEAKALWLKEDTCEQLPGN